MRARAALICVVSSLVWLAAPAHATTLNVGHRGHSAGFPENTLAALNGAFAAGADMVEIDLQKSQDGFVVIMHDETLDRTTNGAGRVDAQTLAQLQTLDAGSWFGPAFAGEPIPTLEEALLAGLGQGPLLLDQKSGLTFGAEIAAAVATTAFPIADLWVTVWEVAQVLDIQAQAALAGVRMLWTQTVAASGQSVADYLDHKVTIGVDGISVVFENYSITHPTLLAEAHARGLLAYAWNLEPFFPETPAKMEQAVLMGLDGYIVNDPGLFATYVPEPSLAVLVAFGLAAVGVTRARPTTPGAR